MTDAALILTFGPVQPFIAEARRAADLRVGSQILVRLAKAAAQAIGLQSLVYPAAPEGVLPDDLPNVIAARVSAEEVPAIAKRASEALLSEWSRLGETAKGEVQGLGLAHDSTWDEIWGRQIGHVWQIFWSAAPIGPGDWGEAYEAARAGLNAVKNSRLFIQVVEPGDKDSLSGAREALHLQGQKARDYWREAAAKANPGKLRPQGRERLDAIGAIKRFCELAKTSLPSTSTVASADFRESARLRTPLHLEEYRGLIEEALGTRLYRARVHDPQWPYDGDLFFLETLEPLRLADSYHGVAKGCALAQAQEALRRLYEAVQARPSSYYAVIVLDGDSIGRRIAELLQQPQPEDAHRLLSQKLAGFARRVPEALGATFRRATGLTAVSGSSDSQIGQEFLVYNGGDDVLLLAPLAHALPMARALASEFAKIVTPCSASAGVAVAHHLYPLDAVLQAARAALKRAKEVPGKATVSVCVIKRSGERSLMEGKWDTVCNVFEKLVAHFAEEWLSSRFAYELSRQAPVCASLPGDARRALIARLVDRHSTAALPDPDILTNELWQCAQALDVETGLNADKPADHERGMARLSQWVLFARFVAKGGGE